MKKLFILTWLLSLCIVLTGLLQFAHHHRKLPPVTSILSNDGQLQAAPTEIFKRVEVIDHTKQNTNSIIRGSLPPNAEKDSTRTVPPPSTPTSEVTKKAKLMQDATPVGKEEWSSRRIAVGSMQALRQARYVTIQSSNGLYLAAVPVPKPDETTATVLFPGLAILSAKSTAGGDEPVNIQLLYT